MANPDGAGEIKRIGVTGATAAMTRALLGRTDDLTRAAAGAVRLVIDQAFSPDAISEEEIARACERLNACSVDTLVMPSEMDRDRLFAFRKKHKTPIVDHVGVLIDALKSRLGSGRVALLTPNAAPVPASTRAAFAREGYELVDFSPVSADAIGRLLDVADAAADRSVVLKALKKALVSLEKKDDVEATIVFLPLDGDPTDAAPSDAPVIDGLRELARYLVDYARGAVSFPMDLARIEAFWKDRAERMLKGELGLFQCTMLTATEEEAVARDKIEKEGLMTPLRPYLRPAGDMLELGCGVGRWSRTLRGYVREIDAYDISATLIETAQRVNAEQGIQNVHFRQARVEDIVPGKPYDYVVCIGLLPYLDDTGAAKILRLIRDGVKVGGLAVFRESLGVSRRFELHGFYSETLDMVYDAVYRTDFEIKTALGDDYALLYEKTIIPPTDKKPETCQKVLLFRRTR